MLYEFLNVDKTSSTLLYEQLYDNITNAITGGMLKKGDKLPSVRALANDLAISRTTVETAYEQLCAEGYLKTLPKKGFFVEAEGLDLSAAYKTPYSDLHQKTSRAVVRYDFSSSAVDPACNDIKFWRRCIKDELDKQFEMTTYGDPRGEAALRAALCEYSRRVRYVQTTPDNIVIGAGTQTLLSVLLGLCGDYGFDAAMEKGFFPQGEQIFSDFRYTITPLSADKSGIILSDSVKSRVLLINSSGSIRGSAPIPVSKRAEIIRWAEHNDAIIIEDDFNGELRCTSKPVPALQSMCPQRVVFIGSFSKLLLPSVRISYMVLPPDLAKIYSLRMSNYNQTASKAEQLALARYISCGRLDRRLRLLRKTYSEKAEIMLAAIKRTFPPDTIAQVIDTALCVRIKLRINSPMQIIKAKAEQNGIRLGKCREKNGLKYFYLSFAGLPSQCIEEAVLKLYDVLSESPNI